MEPAKPRILAVLPSMLPTAMIYVVRPLTELARKGKLEFTTVIESQATKEQLAGWDIAVYVRNSGSRFNSVFEELKALQTKIIYEVDDNLWEVPENNPSKMYHLDEQMRQVEHYLRNVDLVKVYNPLVEDLILKFFNRKVFRALAGIDLSLAPSVALSKTHETIQLVYATARGGADELFELILPDLRQALIDFKDKIELVLWKNNHPDLVDLPNVRVLPVEGDYEKFMKEFCSAGYEIGLAPMIDSLFYNSKTNTKFRDYGLARIAGIYSRSLIYSTVEDGVTGLVVNTGEGQWYRAIQQLVEDPALRMSIQENAYSYVYEHYRQELMEEEWLAVIDQLMGNNNHTEDPDGLHIEIIAGHEAQDGFALMTSPEKSEQIFVNLNQPLPFSDHAIQNLTLIESLETVKDMRAFTAELYRVCRHGATLKVLARYGQNQKVMADPNVCQMISEQTFRQWTTAQDTFVYEKDYAPDGYEPWGQIVSSKPALDMRCLGLEFFYRPEFRGLSAEERRKARHKFLNVCDLLYGSFVVIKEPVSEEQMMNFKDQSKMHEPPQVILRRKEEEVALLQARVDQLQVESRNKELEIQRWKNQPYRQKAIQLLSEYDSLRNNRLVRILLRLTDRTDYLGRLSPAFAPLVTTSKAANGELSGFFLRPGVNLQTVDFVTYPIRIGTPHICAVLLALRAELPVMNGTVGIELVSPAGKIVAQSTLPAAKINDTQPTEFSFAPFAESSAGEFSLRVFSRGADAPVTLLEYQKYGLRGFGRLHRRPFVGFKFEQ